MSWDGREHEKHCKGRGAWGRHTIERESPKRPVWLERQAGGEKSWSSVTHQPEKMPSLLTAGLEGGRPPRPPCRCGLPARAMTDETWGQGGSDRGCHPGGRRRSATAGHAMKIGRLHSREGVVQRRISPPTAFWEKKTRPRRGAEPTPARTTTIETKPSKSCNFAVPTHSPPDRVCIHVFARCFAIFLLSN